MFLHPYNVNRHISIQVPSHPFGLTCQKWALEAWSLLLDCTPSILHLELSIELQKKSKRRNVHRFRIGYVWLFASNAIKWHTIYVIVITVAFTMCVCVCADSMKFSTNGQIITIKSSTIDPIQCAFRRRTNCSYQIASHIYIEDRIE